MMSGIPQGDWNAAPPDYEHDWSNISAKHYQADDEPTAEIPETYKVTFWATVESGDQTTHIPINNTNVSGKLYPRAVCTYGQPLIL